MNLVNFEKNVNEYFLGVNNSIQHVIWYFMTFYIKINLVVVTIRGNGKGFYFF